MYRHRRSSASRFNASDSSNRKTTNKIGNKFLYHILNWDPAWLRSKEYNEVLPAMINDVQLLPAQLQYEDVEQYQNVMFPMLIHEFWHVLKNDYRELGKTKIIKKVITNKPTISQTSRDYIPVDDKGHKIFSFNLEATIKVVKSRRPMNPHRGDLVLLKGVKASENSAIFAYIKDVDESCSRSELKYNIMTSASAWSYSNSEFSLTSFSFLMGYLSLIDALDRFQEFPLCKSVLHPDVESYQFPLGQELDLFSIKTKQNLNTTQSEVIAGLLEAIKQPKPKILLVQGPPGTGKSMTIVNLIAMIRQLQQKILLCAPSNKAIDSVVLRLLDVKPILQKQGVHLGIVRVGDEDKMDVSVKEISLSCLAEKQRVQGRSVYNIKQNILINADVIASTLTSCYTSNVMTSVFCLDPFDALESSSSLGVCIVDEAAQATELLTMVPCLLGMNKLILVGDPEQLRPIVLSEKAKDHGYDTSLFARAHKIFADEEKNPIVMLDTQYRMSKVISEWPNSFFYNGALKDAASVKPLGICNYKLFNHNFPQDDDGHANQKEAELVVKLIKLLRQKLNLKVSNKISVGVITPYHKQRKLIQKMLYPYMKTNKGNKKSNEKNEKLIEESEKNSDSDLNKKLEDKDKSENSSNDENSSRGFKTSKNTLKAIDIAGNDIAGLVLDDNDDFHKIGCDDDLDILVGDCMPRNLVKKLEEKSTISSTENSKQKPEKNSQDKIIEEDQFIEVNTVDSFQGSERDIIIMSCVRSCGIGFTKDPNRLCVSLTRAKHTLIMIGNFKAFAGNEMWSSLINNAAERKVFVNIGDADAEPVLREHVIYGNLKECSLLL